MNKSKLLTFLFNVSNLFPVFLFIAYVLIFSQNIIILDDYGAVAETFIETSRGKGVFEKIKCAFGQKNEYRLPLIYIVSQLQYSLFNKLYLNIYPLIGNLCIFLLSYILFKIYYKGKNKYMVLCISFFLFPLHVFLIITWAITSMQYICAVVYSIIGIYFLLKPNFKDLLFAMLFATLAVFSFGSGILILPLGMVILLYKKEIKKAVYWALLSSAILVIYFYDYKGLPLRNNSLELFLQDPKHVFQGFFYLMGGWVDVIESKHIFWEKYSQLFAGLLLTIIVLYTFIKILKKYFIKKVVSFNEEFFFFATLLLFGIMSLIAFGRSGVHPEIVCKLSSHRYYSFTTLSLVYLYYHDRFSKKVFLGLYCAMAILYFLGLNKYLAEGSNRAKVVAADSYNIFRKSMKYNFFTNNFDKTNKELSDLNVYNFPETEMHKKWLSFEIGKKTTSLFKKSLTIANNTEFVSFEKTEEVKPFYTVGEYILLKSESKLFVLPFARSVTRRFNPIGEKSRSFAYLDKKVIEKGSYKVYIMKNFRLGEIFQETDKVIVI